MNKREFVVGGCAALAGSAARAAPSRQLATGAGTVPGLRRRRMPDLATESGRATWQPYIGHRFQVDASGTAVTLVLGSINLCDASAGFDQFSLSLETVTGPRLPTGSYRLRHASGQEVLVYLETVDFAGRARASYRADFNLMA